MPTTLTLGDNLYTNQTAIELKFGKDNVAKWSNLDGGDPATDKDLFDLIAARIEAAIAWASREIDGYIQARGHYRDVPFKLVPTIINEIATSFAGWKLWTARGVESKNKVMFYAKKEADLNLRRIVNGSIVLPSVRRSKSGPSVNIPSIDEAAQAIGEPEPVSPETPEDLKGVLYSRDFGGGFVVDYLKDLNSMLTPNGSFMYRPAATGTYDAAGVPIPAKIEETFASFSDGAVVNLDFEELGFNGWIVNDFVPFPGVRPNVQLMIDYTNAVRAVRPDLKLGWYSTSILSLYKLHPVRYLVGGAAEQTRLFEAARDGGLQQFIQAVDFLSPMFYLDYEGTVANLLTATFFATVPYHTIFATSPPTTDVGLPEFTDYINFIYSSLETIATMAGKPDIPIWPTVRPATMRNRQGGIGAVGSLDPELDQFRVLMPSFEGVLDLMFQNRRAGVQPGGFIWPGNRSEDSFTAAEKQTCHDIVLRRLNLVNASTLA